MLSFTGVTGSLAFVGGSISGFDGVTEPVSCCTLDEVSSLMLVVFTASLSVGTVDWISGLFDLDFTEFGRLVHDCVGARHESDTDSSSDDSGEKLNSEFDADCMVLVTAFASVTVA